MNTIVLIDTLFKIWIWIFAGFYVYLFIKIIYIKYIITTTTSNMSREINPPEPFYVDSFKIKMYYNNTDLFNYDKKFYYGCTNKPKTIVIKKKIPEREYFYANLKKGNWNLSSSECKKSQLLISKEWVDKYYFKIDERKEPTIIQEPINIIKENIINEELNVPILEEELTINQQILEAPKILLLDDSEKFKDTDGNIITIETRGTKDRKNIYFKVSDVSKGFNMKYLNDALSKKDGGYEKKIHYKIFLVKTNNTKFIKSLYLTYYGFLKLINCSRNNSEFFVKNNNIITEWLDNVTTNYGRIGRDYMGHSAELQQQIRELKEKLLKLNYENERLTTLLESNDKYHKLELKNKDCIIENKDLKIENLELKLLTSNIK